MPELLHARPSTLLRGDVRVPGDKSISHRAIMLGAIAQGTTRIAGFLEGEDALSTMNVFRALGVRIDGPEQGHVVVHGVGLHGLSAPKVALDCGNSGTSMRLLAGLLAGQGFEARLVGDASLTRRPMRRVTEPLARMGAQIVTQTGCPPLRIRPAPAPLQGLRYELPVASAQVKSALMLAGLYAEGETTVIEPAPTRDHTERMLRGFGVHVDVVPQASGSAVTIRGGQVLHATEIDIPADISSAAFFMVAAAIAPDADVLLRHVGVNPTRTGIVEILRLMGARLTVLDPRTVGGELVADIRVQSSELRGIAVPPELVPLAIDEFPALFVAAACAEGRTLVTGAEELRVKESDRIAVMADGLRRLGVDAIPTPDGIVIEGRGAQSAVFTGGEVDSHGDHRPAMSFAIAALRASAPIRIRDTANVATSFPQFVALARSLGLDVAVEQVSA